MKKKAADSISLLIGVHLRSWEKVSGNEIFHTNENTAHVRKLTRRHFLQKSAFISAFAALTLLLLGALRSILPALTRKNSMIKIDSLANLPMNSFTLLHQAPIFIYRDHEGVRALSAVCTHLGCTLATTDEGFQCPCHGSHFDQTGQVQDGPAPRSLAWYKMIVGADGQLYVDTAHKTNADDKLIIS